MPSHQTAAVHIYAGSRYFFLLETSHTFEKARSKLRLALVHTVDASPNWPFQGGVSSYILYLPNPQVIVICCIVWWPATLQPMGCDSPTILFKWMCGSRPLCVCLPFCRKLADQKSCSKSLVSFHGKPYVLARTMITYSYLLSVKQLHTPLKEHWLFGFQQKIEGHRMRKPNITWSETEYIFLSEFPVFVQIKHELSGKNGTEWL